MTALKKKIFKWALFSTLLIGTTSGIVAYKMWTKPHRNVEEAKGIAVAAIKLAADYENNEPEANKDYLDKVLEGASQIVAANQ